MLQYSPCPSRGLNRSARLALGPVPLSTWATAFITCADPKGAVCIVDLTTGHGFSLSPAQIHAPGIPQPPAPPKPRIGIALRAGHRATAPVLSPDGKTLYVCNRFNNDVSVFDLDTMTELRRIPVECEPVAAALTLGTRYLLIANHLPNGRANVENVAAGVSVLDLAAGRVLKQIRLPTGSGSLNDLRISPDGKYAAVTHIFASFSRAATQVHLAWLNANALSIIDVDRLALLATVLLDTPESGAANPWGIVWSADGGTLCVTHAGTHELSVIDFRELLAALGPDHSGPASATNLNFRATTIIHQPLRAAESNLSLAIRRHGPRSTLPHRGAPADKTAQERPRPKGGDDGRQHRVCP